MWGLLRGCARTAAKPRLSHVLLCRKRHISTANIDPSIREFTSTLASKQPVLELQPSSVHILNEPSEFYTTLLGMINKAERRIFLSSLYIGSEETELLSAISRRLHDNPDLRLDILLDFNRSTRPGKDSTAKALLPLIEAYPERVCVFMFRSPSLRGILASLVPPRFNEGWGTWHAKIYGADDNVMISGANLNKSYFTDRQDRYIHFSGQTLLAQYCYDFMATVFAFSYKLLPVSTIQSNLSSDNLYSYTSDNYTLQWPDSDTHPHYFNSLAESALNQLQKNYLKHTKQLTHADTTASTSNALLIPIIQAGQFNVREEESVFQLLFRHIAQNSNKKRPRLDLTSGYFSLYPPYQTLICDASTVDCRIVAASPQANGFFGSTGISGRIPEGYTLYEKRFMKAVAKAGRLWIGPSSTEGRGVLLNEWEKSGWTYHAKGIWLSPSASSLPFLTLFGSTNLNSRSAHIDTELSFLMIIPSDKDPAIDLPTDVAAPESPLLALRRSLAREVENIRSNAREWKGDDRHVRWTTKLIVWLVRGML